jgi:hypothetical protein
MAMAIESSFKKNPEIGPDCSNDMMAETIYSSHADVEIKALVKAHVIFLKGISDPSRGRHEFGELPSE